MLQRIQSVYLAIAAVLSLVLFFISFSVVFPESEPANVTELSVLSFDSGHGSIVKPASYLALLALNVLTLLLSIYALFKFKNRSQQIKLTRLAVFTSLLLLGGMFLYTDIVKQKIDNAHISYMYGIVAPIFQAVLLVFAASAIKKDDDLVRSADRLR